MENENRQKRIVRASVLGIIVNLCIAAAKILVGVAASSMAIISEGINNATDAASSVLTLVGTKLSAKHPNKEHPFGYGRIEYLTGLTVAILILYTGISLMISSVKGLFNPEEPDVSILALVLVAGSAVVKFLLGTFVIREGDKVDSASLVAVGKDSRNDSLLSIVTIAASVFFMLTHITLDAVVGILFSVVICKSGYETFMDTVSELIGRSGKEDLAKQIYKEIRSTKGILNAADMMLHNYGPDSWSGSVNIEIDHNANIGDVYEYLHALQLRIMQQYHVTMVFGIYAVNNDGQGMREMRAYIAKFVSGKEHVISYHALYQNPENGKLYVDLVVDYDLSDWDALRSEFFYYMKQKYPDADIELTVETEFV